MPAPTQGGSAARIALVLQGDPTDPASWSGVPTGVTSGLVAAGCEVVPVRAELRGAGRIAQLLRMSWIDQTTSRAFAAASGAVANRALRTAGNLDGAIAIGSGYSLNTTVPYVTFEDMTVAQALRLPDTPYAGIDEAASKRWRARQQRIYEGSRGCGVGSSWAADSIRDDYGIAAAKIHAVGFGRNIEVSPAAEKSWTVPRFLHVGVDWERKRGGAVVTAFAAVRQRHPEATLDLVGNHPWLDEPGVTGHGKLPLGSSEGQAKYKRLLAAATCFLMPSTFEPFGIAYLDAGAFGLPSIGTTVGGAADAVGDGGLLVDPDKPDALPEAMLEITDPETARRLGERAAAHSAQFTWQAVAERLLRILQPPQIELDALADFPLSPARDPTGER